MTTTQELMKFSSLRQPPPMKQILIDMGPWTLVRWPL